MDIFTWVLCLIASHGVRLSEAGKGGGKTASKVGLAAISQTGGGSNSGGASAVFNAEQNSRGSNGSLMLGNVIARLKHQLFYINGYDKSVRPVRNHSESIKLSVDVSYIQVLRLNEKDQILKSLLRYRLSWKDEYLTWNPADYAGITSLRVPSNILWIPDVVCYEEIGVKDYTPRIPYIEIASDGLVRYFEPTALETTCSVNIAMFPFDYQTCKMTFTPWTFPTSKVDIQATRGRDEMLQDIAVYFVNTGEWFLDDTHIKKTSQSYVALLATHEEEDEDEHADHEDVENILEQKFFHMDPQKRVDEIAPGRLTDLHWSEVQYKFTFRRNSSLYMQSMVFPALLLMTISLLGFYLPPDSGERIGLQITIMLTFMVFLLTVGDMFPASTGPYLGLYFVLCMAMLGLNMIMTVLVLHLHHMPCASVIKGPNDDGVYSINMKAVPYWIKGALFFSGLYPELTSFKLTVDDIRGRKSKIAKTSVSAKVKPIFNLVRSKTLGSIKVSAKATEKTSDFERAFSNESFELPGNPVKFSDKSGQRRRAPSTVRFRAKSSSDSLTDVDNPEHTGNRRSKSRSPLNDSDIDALFEGLSQKDKFSDRALAEACRELTSVGRDVSNATDYLRCQYDELRDDKRSEGMEDKWRDVARKLDVVCLYLYLFILLMFHLCLVIIIFAAPGLTDH